MQLGAAAIFLLEAVSSVAIALLFINRDSMLRALQAQGTAVPQGTTIDDIVNISLGISYAFVVFFAVLEVIGAVGSFMGWRWMFWVALVLFGLGGLSNVFSNLGSLVKPASSPVPLGGLVFTEVVGILTLAMFVWMLVGVIKYGPWAMRRPGSSR